MDLYLSLLPAVFAVIPVLYTIAASLHESTLAIEYLLNSLLESLFESLFERAVFERAAPQEEYSFPWKAFGRWQTLSLWKLWLMDSSKSVEALANGKL